MPNKYRWIDVIRALRNHKSETRSSPTLSELCDLTGIRSTQQIAHLLAKLEREGYIERRTPKSRAIKLSYRGVHVDLDRRHHCSSAARLSKVRAGQKSRAMNAFVHPQSVRVAEMQRIEAVVAKALKKEQDGQLTTQTLDAVRDYPRGSMKCVRVG